MSELAFNISGEPFELPAGASGWRVRRLKQKGAPEVVYGRDGTPLSIPLDADLEELRAEAGAVGRYRLDPIDEAQRPIPNAQAAYVYVHANAQPSGPVQNTSLPPSTDSVVIEAMRMNAEMARSIIDRFPQMLESPATLLRAADGAGLPSRQPRASDEHAEEDSEDEEPAGFDLNAMVAQLVPMLAMAFTKGKVKMPDLASTLDWRKASPKEAKAIATADASAHATENKADALPALDPQTMAHFIAIQSALKPEEAAMAREVAGNLSAAELHSWFDELKKLTVPQAVQKIRVLIAGNTEAVS